VPSTLHQMVKFEWDRQEIFVHGQDNQCTPGDAIMPSIESEDNNGTWVYLVFDAVSVQKVPKGEVVATPKITTASVMVASEMLRNGVIPGKGLEASLQGIAQPVSLPKNIDTFGLAFKPTAPNIRRARKMRQKTCVLPKPIPRLSKSFVKPINGPRPKISGPLIDAEGDLDKGLERLF